MKIEVLGLRKVESVCLCVIFCLCLFASAFAVGFKVGYSLGRRFESQKILFEFEKSFNELREEVKTLRILERIIEYESGGKHKGIWGDNGRSYGIVQFKKGTFYWLAALSGAKGLRWQSEYDQVLLLKWALENGFGNHWSTYERAFSEVESGG